MKNIAITLTLGLLVVFGANAQSKKLTGPAYKNKKVWETSTETTKIYTKSGESLKGPQAKNASPMERKSGKSVLVAFGSKDEQLKGPEYKNRKPWVDQKEDSMYAKDKKQKKDDGDGMTGSK